MEQGEGKGIVAGLAVALGGGIVILALLVVLFQSLDSSSGSTKTVTATAAAPATTAPATTGVTTQPASQQPAEVVLGARTYVAFACGACHGWKGEGTPSAGVPPLTTAGQEFTSAQLRKIIDGGAPTPIPSDPTKPFMPVWGPVISDQQVGALVSYINAGMPPIQDIVPPDVPAGASDEVAGSILYQKLGCINCHGPNGLGGVPNPASPDKSVPPLSGAVFRSEFDTDQKIADVIMSGSVLGKGQIVSMPHWGGVLTDAEVAQLVAFIKTLKAK
jgi:mono/diheme cytochrome c family protein